MHSWSPLAKDPYIAAGPASADVGEPPAHRVAGTRAFAWRARTHTNRSSASKLSRPASWKRQAATTTAARPRALLETSRDDADGPSGQLSRSAVSEPADWVAR